MRMFDTVFIISIICLSGCADSDRKDTGKTTSVGLYAPLSESDVSHLVVTGMTKEELLIKCGEPLLERKTNNMELLIFQINFDDQKIEGPNIWAMSHFVVTVSNGYVASWRPSGKRMVQ